MKLWCRVFRAIPSWDWHSWAHFLRSVTVSVQRSWFGWISWGSREVGSFPSGTGGKEPASQCMTRRRGGWIPGWGEFPGEGNGNLLQYSCLENPVDGGAWRATVHWVTRYRTGLSDWACGHRGRPRVLLALTYTVRGADSGQVSLLPHTLNTASWVRMCFWWGHRAVRQVDSALQMNWHKRQERNTNEKLDRFGHTQI